MAGSGRGDRQALAERFRALTDRLAGTLDIEETLTDVATLAASTVPGADWAGITQMAQRHHPRTLAASDPIVHHVDQLQYRLGEGPCVQAAQVDGVFLADDLATDSTWPRFGARTVAQTAVRSVLSLTISPFPPRAALNLYGPVPAVFTPDSVQRARLFAAHAQVLLAYTRAVQKVVNLNRALATSRVIGAAVGILMRAREATADDAFDGLVRASQHLNRKLSDIAEEVTVTGALPADKADRGRRRRPLGDGRAPTDR